MPNGTGTIEEIQAQAEKSTLNFKAPVQPVVDKTVVPAPSLAEGVGMQPIQELGAVDKIKLAYQVADPVTSAYFKMSEEYEQEYDNEFDLTEHKDLFTDLDDSLYDYMFESTSYNDALYRRQEIKTEQENMSLLMQDNPVSGMVYFMGASIANPVTIASLAIEGAGALRVMSKASRMARMYSTGALAGITAGVETAALAGTKATVDTEDVLYTGLAGFSLGFGVGAIGKSALAGDDLTSAADYIQDSVSRNAMQGMDEKLADDLLNTGKKTVFSTDEESLFGKYDPELLVKDIQEGADGTLEDVQEVFRYDKALFDQVRTAKEEGRFKPELIKNSKVYKILTKNPLQSDFIRLFDSPSEEVQYFAMELLENASGIGGRQKTASILQSTWKKKHLDNLMPVMHTAYKTFAKKNNVQWYKMHKYFGSTRDEFNKIIRTELENYSQSSYKGGKYVSEAEEYIQTAVNAWRKEMDEMYELAKTNKVKGFEDIVAHDGYVPLIWDGKALIKMGKSARARYAKLAQRGYMDMGITEKDAEVIQGSVFNRQISNATGLDTNPSALLAKDSREFLRETLVLNKMKPKDIDALFSRIDTTLSNRGKSARARSRVPINLNIADNELHLMDIVSNDLSTIGTRYITEMSGRSALARKGVRHDGAFTGIKAALLKSAADSGDTDTVRLGKILDGLYNQFLGRPVGSGVHAIAGNLQDWATASMLGMTGFPQMAELGNVIGAHGISAVFKYAPTLREYKAAVKAGTADKTVLGELRAGIGGLWGEDLFYRPEVRLEQAGEGSASWAMIKNALAGSKQAVMYASGMNSIKNMEQQLVAVMQANKVIGMLKKGTGTPNLLARFADSGWDQKFLDKLKKQIDNRTITFQPNGAVDALNMSKWSPELIEEFSVGMHRHSQQLIQFPNIGETAYWQHETIGSMLSQFRSFTLQAIEKQSARQMHVADPEAFATLAWSAGLAATLYMTKVQATSIGRPDREEYLEKRLSAGAVINGSMAWMGILSATSEVVNAGSFVGLLPPNAYTGGSARGGAPVPPSMSVAWSAAKAASGVGRGLSPFGEYDAGKQEINNAFAATAFGNIYPAILLKNVLQGTVDD